MVSIFKKIRKLTWRQRLLYTEATAALFLAKVLLTILPTRWVFKIIGFQVLAQAIPPKAQTSPHLTSMGRALHLISLRLPFSSTCLVQAIAGAVMLKIRNRPANLCIGVTKQPNGQLAAHAWLVSDQFIVTGGNEQQDFAMIASFLKDNT